MRAVILRSGRPQVVDRPDPSPAPGEALVRPLLAGICGTDLEIARGYLGFEGIPGHEFVGVVEASTDLEWLGARVVGEINASCGGCAACAAGLGRHCPNRTVLGITGRDGAFAERVTLPLANLHRVPATVPNQAAVFAEPLAAAYEILEQLKPSPGIRAIVLGDGRLGQLCARVLRRAGIEVTVVGKHQGKLARLEASGIPVHAASEDLPRSFDWAVEATGRPEGLRRALGLVRPRGTVVVKSTYHGEAPFALADLVINEVSVVGSRCGPFPPALAHLAEDPAPLVAMIDACYPLEEAERAFAEAARPGVLKVLLRPQAS